nr:MAG TPA: zinc-ribbon containing domain protein [Caudoviricetes sp.]
MGDDMELQYACLQPKFCEHCGQRIDWSECNG